MAMMTKKKMLSLKKTDNMLAVILIAFFVKIHEAASLSIVLPKWILASREEQNVNYLNVTIKKTIKIRMLYFLTRIY